MAVKQVFEIKDKLLEETTEVCGQGGFLHDDDYTIMLIDPRQIGQNIMEETAQIINEEKFQCSSQQINKRAKEIAEYIYHITLYEITKNTINIIKNEDDTELI